MICGCVLPYYNPEACKHCTSNVREYNEFRNITPIGFKQEPVIAGKKWEKPEKRIKINEIIIKTKKVTERYDTNGNLIERIVEENV